MKEQEIIKRLTLIPNVNSYGYKALYDLKIMIARVMGYEVLTFYRSYSAPLIKHDEDREKVEKIIAGMEKRNIIKLSKAGSTFKVVQ